MVTIYPIPNQTFYLLELKIVSMPGEIVKIVSLQILEIKVMLYLEMFKLSSASSKGDRPGDLKKLFSNQRFIYFIFESVIKLYWRTL